MTHLYHYITFLLLTVSSGLLYWMGGYGKPFNTKCRDFGCPAMMVLTMWLLGQLHWALFFCFGAMFGACTTYWKRKGSDAQWYNWALHSFFIGLSMIFWVYFTHHSFLWFGIYVLAVTGTMTTWSQLIGNVFFEEFGRGALIIMMLPLLIL